jgi:tRNA C32,U32 (ribose-2'-O)-methylase TrmJ
VVVAAAGPAAVRAEDFDWETSPTAFVVGNEARGVSEEARALCDAEIMVPMVGMVESLNVSVASACILQAALGRIRQKSGADFSSSSASPSASSNSEFEEEVEALTAAMLLRHKGQQGKVGALWQAPMMRAILERGGGVER